MPTLAELRLFARYHLVRRDLEYPARDGGLDVAPLGYDPRTFADAVRGYGDRFDVEEVAAPEHAGVRHPIFSITTRGASTRRLLVLSGVHGNEEAGILSVPPILDRLLAEGATLPGVGVRILTPVNAVGAAYGSRLNGDGYDVNRDFASFLTREARVARDAMDDFAPDFVISLHEGPQDATFVFSNEHVPRALADELLAVLRGAGVALATHDYFGAELATPGLSPSSRVGRALLDVWAATLGMMPASEHAARRGLPELTLESGWRSPDREARLRPHVELVLAVARSLAR